MNKKDVQKRVSQFGKPLALSKFNWDEKTNTFSSNEDNLILDFYGVLYCTFKTGSSCTFKTGSYCTFKTGGGCTFKTGGGCTFNTSSSCTFKTGSDCTFTTGGGCTFTTGGGCVIIRRDTFQVIQPEENEAIVSCPWHIPGYISKKENQDCFYLNGDTSLGEHIIVDSILSKVISRKNNVWKVINHNETKESFIVFDGELSAHGSTIDDARESLIYKISVIDTSVYNDLTVDSVVSFEDLIKMYRAITGACSGGTKYFVKQQNKVKDKYSIQEVIDLTVGQYGHEKFKEFFNK